MDEVRIPLQALKGRGSASRMGIGSSDTREAGDDGWDTTGGAGERRRSAACPPR